MTISTSKVGLLGAVALVAMAPTAMASSVSISTDRVQVNVGTSGQVYIRTLADRPQIGSQFPTPQMGLPAAAVPVGAAPGCVARSQTAHSTRSTAGGNVVYSENRSTTRVCQ